MDNITKDVKVKYGYQKFILDNINQIEPFINHLLKYGDENKIEVTIIYRKENEEDEQEQ